LESATKRGHDHLIKTLAARGVEVAGLEDRLRAQRVETPSCGYGNAGTRFKDRKDLDVDDGVARIQALY
jgi:L-rhamnose isomerase/sugar isomerase